MIGETKADFNGSELQKLQNGSINGRLMAFDLLEEKQNQAIVLSAIQAGLVKVPDCAEGGLAVALAESAFKKNVGISVQLDLPQSWFFQKHNRDLCCPLLQKIKTAFEALAGDSACLIGKVTAEPQLKIQGNDGMIVVETALARKKWEEAIPCLLK